MADQMLKWLVSSIHTPECIKKAIKTIVKVMLSPSNGPYYFASFRAYVKESAPSVISKQEPSQFAVAKAL